MNDDRIASLEEAVPPGPLRPVPVLTSPLAQAREAWVQAVQAVSAFEHRRPPGRDRAA